MRSGPTSSPSTLVILTESASIFSREKHVSGADLHTLNIASGFKSAGWEVHIVSLRDGSNWDLRKEIDDQLSGYYITRPPTAVSAPRDVIAQATQLFGRSHVLLRQFTARSLSVLRLARDAGAEKIVLQVVDAGLLCARSKLVRATGIRCQGPVSQEDCLRCSFSHRHPIVDLAAGAALQVDSISGSLLPPLSRRLAGFKARVTDCFRWQEIVDSCDLLAFQSAALRDVFIANGLSPQKTCMTITGAETAKSITLEERPTLTGPLIVGYAGQIEFDKGFDRAYQAIESLRSQIGDKVRLVVGSKPSSSGYNREWMRKIRRCSWATWAPYNGKDCEAVSAWHRGIHALCVPSRWIDNRPNVALEAMVRRTPVLCPDVGCFREMIVDGVNGYLFQAGEPDNLGRLLQKLIFEPGMLRELYSRRERTVSCPEIHEEVNSLISAF